MAFAEINGQQIYYEERGEGEPLVCVQGLATDHHGFLPNVREFMNSYRTVTFDNRDVGQSFRASEQYEITDMAGDLLGLADDLGLESFHLLGVSLGGAVSQEAALAAPERVRTLTLAVSWGGFGEWGRARFEGRLARLDQLDEDELLEELLLLTLSEKVWNESPEFVQLVRDATKKNPHPQDKDAFARQAHASGYHETRDRLGGLQLPVHVIGAEYDMLIPVWKSKELAELIPAAKLTVVPEAPHGLNVERSDEFNTAVLGFIGEHAPARA